ncbi:MAG: ATP-dependent DNA helicase RecG [Phycisphaeraceae bacterium]|nr:ATP-dependent DNA helicase RecG [Phycisphaeraceae bacterium]
MSSTAITLNGALESLPGVGPRTAAALARLGLHTIADLLRHLPLRYEHERAEHSISECEAMIPQRPGAEAHLSVRGEIAVSRIIRRARPRVEATLEDETGSMRLVWFNATWMDRRVRPGTRGVAQGKAARRQGYLEMVNPTWEVIAGEREPPPRSERIRPIYPASEALPSSRLEAMVETVLDAAIAQIDDPLPPDYRRTRDLPEVAWAWRAMHRPTDLDEVSVARRRLAFDELFILQLGVMMRRSQWRRAGRAATLPLTRTIDERIRARLPHRLTPEQEVVVAEIVQDLARGVPMNRLLQGDVGSGKTLVALFAMLLAVAQGHQAALVAPTEILAEQHHQVLRTMLAMSQVEVALLTAGRGAARRAETLAALADGSAGIVIGTHAILEPSVRFKSLALAVIDEQHRFGVHQRAALRAKSDGPVPHVLVMTATPIPRTMGMTLYGDLDVSTLRGRPPGRRPVLTRFVSGTKAPEVYAYVRGRLDRGEQAFVVVPAVDESDAGLKDVRSHLEFLRSGPFQGLEIDMVHGRMGGEERDAVMSRFRRGALAALVATVVIEVGVDVPNATMMIVEHADRFGLAQLHQLRGRVGRGEKASLCVFIADPVTPEATERLESIARIDDGFEIAEIDLKLRGPGELFGARQSGLPPFRVADLTRDGDLLRMARRDAQEWIDRDPDLRAPEVARLKRKLMATCGEALGLADVG